jgi:mannose-6-phosphate isomerase-like protein (cupin superfamily)
VKHIVVNPGASLSLQMHHRRAEHWTVIRGEGLITCDDREFVLRKNESTFIPLGSKHRASNPGTETVEIIEVQIGDYLGEDDIVRFEDKYGRASQGNPMTGKQ